MKKPAPKKSAARKKSPVALAPVQRAEAELTAFGLTLPEANLAPGWVPTRALNFRKKTFFIFGDRNEAPGALTMIMKLPTSAEMIRDLYFVQESKGWFLQHNWVIVRFGPDDDIMAEMDTLKGWMVQSFCAVAPKKVARAVEAAFKGET